MNLLFKCFSGYLTVNLLYSSRTYASVRKVRKAPPYVYNVTLKKNHIPFEVQNNYIYKQVAFPRQEYDAFLVLDFEATCKTGYNIIKTQEIIEFPCLWVNGSDLRVLSVFHKYVKPVVHDCLDPFCVQLTGITNKMVRNEKHFDVVFHDFTKWYDEMLNKTKSVTTIFVTCGHWDLQKMLPAQASISHIDIPPYMRSWIDIKTAFCQVTGHYPKTLKEMLLLFHVGRKGRLHSGLDDSLNVLSIMKVLARRGHVFYQTNL